MSYVRTQCSFRLHTRTRATLRRTKPGAVQRCVPGKAQTDLQQALPELRRMATWRTPAAANVWFVVATVSEVAVAAFSPLLNILEQVPDPRRAEGKLYKLPHVLLFSILAIVSGCKSYRGIVTFIDVHRQRLNAVFGLQWRRAPAHTAIRYILQGLDPAAVEQAFRHHAGLLQAARQTPGAGSIALDGKILRGSFDRFHDRAEVDPVFETMG